MFVVFFYKPSASSQRFGYTEVIWSDFEYKVAETEEEVIAFLAELFIKDLNFNGPLSKKDTFHVNIWSSLGNFAKIPTSNLSKCWTDGIDVPFDMEDISGMGNALDLRARIKDAVDAKILVHEEEMRLKIEAQRKATTEKAEQEFKRKELQELARLKAKYEGKS